MKILAAMLIIDIFLFLPQQFENAGCQHCPPNVGPKQSFIWLLLTVLGEKPVDVSRHWLLCGFVLCHVGTAIAISVPFGCFHMVIICGLMMHLHLNHFCAFRFPSQNASKASNSAWRSLGSMSAKQILWTFPEGRHEGEGFMDLGAGEWPCEEFWHSLLGLQLEPEHNP